MQYMSSRAYNTTTRDWVRSGLHNENNYNTEYYHITPLATQQLFTGYNFATIAIARTLHACFGMVNSFLARERSRAYLATTVELRSQQASYSNIYSIAQPSTIISLALWQIWGMQYISSRAHAADAAEAFQQHVHAKNASRQQPNIG